MTGAQLAMWRTRLKMTKTAAAAALGMSLDNYSKMEGRALLSRRTALACAAISFGLPPAVG
jgi:hypothetical protein